MKISHLLCCLAFALTISSYGQYNIIKSNTDMIGAKFTYLADSARRTAADIIQNGRFSAQKKEVANFGITKSVIWVKAALINSSTNNDFKLILSYPILDEITFFYPENKLYKRYEYGESVPFNKRLVKHPYYVFNISIPTKTSKTFYFRIKSSEQIIIPIYLRDNEHFAHDANNENLIIGIYAGIVIIMVFYNLFIFFSTKDKSYLFYVIYIGFAGLTQVGIKGYNYQYFWPENPSFQLISLPIFASISGIFALLFAQEFLQSKIYFPKINALVPIFTLLFCFSIWNTLNNKIMLGFIFMQNTTLAISFYIILISLISIKKGQRTAKFFALSWIALMLGSIIFILKDYGIITFNLFTNYIMLAASATETTLLSFALADKINLLSKEKELSQLQALQLAAEKEKLILNQNAILEKKVQERTSSLEKAHETLQAAQIQLINSEKMASLGQLTAGIAHEINNPVNFILNSVLPLKRDIDDLLFIIHKTENLEQKENQYEIVQEIAELKKSLDIDISVNEIHKLLAGIEEGAYRTESIVKGLKSFSHLHEQHVKPFNLNEGIISTLALLKHKLKTQIELHFEPGEIPLVECNGGNINQVFMNLISNAIDAVEEKHKNAKTGRITIETFRSGNKAIIVIRDNGSGMTDDTKKKLFEPFYTTKEVGKGVGLGMSIVYGIIESHKGTISIESEVNIGTTFTIELPLEGE
jgi:signal transduction histidine kinase